MNGFLRTCLDAFFPPHRDVVAAETVSVEDMLGLYRLSYHQTLGTYTALPYRDPAVRALIRANKFHHSLHAARVLGVVFVEMLAGVLDEHALSVGGKPLVIIPIAASPRRMRMRGGNQVEWIIDAMAPEVKGVYEYAPRALARHHRESQTHVQKNKRRENIRGAFFVPVHEGRSPSFVHGATVVLVDDVVESGATMADARRALKEAGARRIIGVALAK